MKRKNLLFNLNESMLKKTRYLVLLGCFLLMSASGFSQDTLAKWMLDMDYASAVSNDTTFYYPTDDAFSASVSTSGKFAVYPDTCLTDSSDYLMTIIADGATASARFELTHETNAIRYGHGTASGISDYTDVANQTNYFQFEFPTLGYDEIGVDFSLSTHAGDADDFLELVYSTDDGATWIDVGDFNSNAQWWVFEDHSASISAKNQEKVLVRLVTSTTVSSYSYVNYFTVTGTKYFGGQTIDNTPTIQWATDGSTTVESMSAVYSGDNSLLFKPEHIAVSSKLTETQTLTVNDTSYVLFNPEVQTSAPDDDNKVTFNITPVTGLEFVPTKITFSTMRFGTSSGKMDVVWRSTDGTATTLLSDKVPTRNNDLVTPTLVSIDLSALTIPASDGECSLELYIHSLGDTKEVGIANVTIDGTLQGTVLEIKSFPLATAVSPEGAGTISTNPVGEEFDSSTVVTVSAAKNFGYSFSHWADAKGANVSSEKAYTVAMDSAIELTAVFNTLNTYALEVVVQEANDYMVAISPAGVLVGEDLMYEEGTKVTIAASENNLYSLSKWNDESTSLETVVSIAEDTTITATYIASDYLVGWDFYAAGSQDRPADFVSDVANAGAVLSMQDEAGTSIGWLDFSFEKRGASGWHGKNCAINWAASASSGNVGDYYYQTSFSTKGFKDIVVSAAMLGSYSYYGVQNIEYSIDGTNFTSAGTITLSAANSWFSGSCTLPSEADDLDAVYVRFIADKASTLTENGNDGTSITDVYVTATPVVADDGTAPVLASSTPEAAAEGTSINGKITLTFDESIQLNADTTAILGAMKLTPEVIGKSIIFSYTGLSYSTEYTFILDKELVADLSGNTISDSIKISFTTMARPAIDKKEFDFIIGQDGSFADALDAIDAASGSGERFYVFLPDGDYNIGELTGDANQMTSVSLSNVSFIGQSGDKTVIFNKSIQEAINSTATLHFSSNTEGIYMQDLSLLNKANYRNESDLSETGRHVALWDQGDKNIYKNVKLLSTQDTYYSGYGRYYWENGEIHGTVDFICGGGDIFFNEVLLYLEERAGNHITAAATNTDWGYVFSNCTIDGFAINNNSYKLGRPWSNAPKVAYLNTTMNILPDTEGWGDPMNVVPSVFAEYNSMKADGSVVNLSNRRTSYTKDATTVELNPVLSETEAAEYTLENVLGGNDAWQPAVATAQVETPVIVTNSDSSIISWDKNDYALCFGIFNNNVFVGFTTDTSYSVPDSVAHAIYTVRAANEMGGLSTASAKFYLNAAEYYATEGTEICSGTSYTFPDDNTVENIVAPMEYTSDLKTTLGYDSTIVTTITVKTVDASISLSNDTVLSAGLSGASYEWVSCDDENTVIGTEQSYTAKENGQYAVKVTDNGCTVMSTCKTVVITDISSITADAINIYPNPTTGSIYLDSDIDLTDSKITVRSITGKVIKEVQASAGMEISLEGNDAGIYFISITSRNGSYEYKVIKN